MLAEKVAKGELPPVEERLPLNPIVLKPFEEIGKYGGTWRRAYRGISDNLGIAKTMEEEGIEWYQVPGTFDITLVPNFYESYEVSADAKEITLHMREGLKWSDGELCDTEDVKFWYEKCLLNDTLYASKPGWLKPGGQLGEITIIDQYTFRWTFANPAPLVLMYMAAEQTSFMHGTSNFLVPEHYLKTYHIDTGDQAEIDKMLKANELQTWDQLWNTGPLWWLRDPKRPILWAWQVTVPPPADPAIFERNPYYWQVDTEGNQLPYIDKQSDVFFDNIEVLTMKIISGEIDCQQRHTNTGDYTLYKENEVKGNYRVIEWIDAKTHCYHPNICIEDPELAKLFGDVRGRHALSVAIDREADRNIVFGGLGNVRQASPFPGSPQYDAEYEKKWTEYDPNAANALLDELGFKERDGDGFRKRADGATLTVSLDFGIWVIPKEVELVAKYWQDVGIKAVLNNMERSLYDERQSNNLLQVNCYPDERSLIIAAGASRYLGDHWGVQYYRWFNTGGKQGIQPPEGHPMYEIWDVWGKAQIEPDEAKRNALIQRMVEINKENIWRIGTIGGEPALVVTSNRMRNVPAGLYLETVTRGKGLGWPQQFYFTE